MTTEIFKSAVRASKNKPKGVVVSPDLFRALDAEKALERKLATIWGVPSFSLGIELPYYDSDVFVGCDTALDAFEFKLPPS